MELRKTLKFLGKIISNFFYVHSQKINNKLKNIKNTNQYANDDEYNKAPCERFIYTCGSCRHFEK